MCHPLLCYRCCNLCCVCLLCCRLFLSTKRAIIAFHHDNLVVDVVCFAVLLLLPPSSHIHDNRMRFFCMARKKCVHIINFSLFFKNFFMASYYFIMCIFVLLLLEDFHLIHPYLCTFMFLIFSLFSLSVHFF